MKDNTKKYEKKEKSEWKPRHGWQYKLKTKNTSDEDLLSTPVDNWDILLQDHEQGIYCNDAINKGSQ